MGAAASSKDSGSAERAAWRGSARRAALLTVLATLTVIYALGTALLPRHSVFLHAWSDFGWLLMTVWAAVECWRARGKETMHRFACIALSAANVASILALSAWGYDELVLKELSPFPTLADAGFIGYAPLYALGIFFLAGGARSLSLSLRHLADLGMAVGAMLFCSVAIYYRPSVELGLPPTQIAVALGYPVASLSATAFGLLAMVQQPAKRRRRVLGLHLCALTLFAIAYTLYGVKILTRKYETGHALDPVWFAGLALSIWAVREDRRLPEEPEPERAIIGPSTLDAMLPAVACALPALVIVTYRSELRHVPALLLAATWIVFVASLALRGVSVMHLERELGRKIQERERELLRAQKMEAVSTLAAGLAHDFNNFLTGIMGATSLLHRRGRTPEQNSSCIEIIDQCALRASEITRRLTSLSRVPDETEHGVVDVARAIRRVESLLRGSISPAIELGTAEVPPSAKIWGNEGEIEQVLLNLGLNAANAMPRGGKLEFSVERRRRSVPAGGDAPFVVVRVRDEGCGIPDSVRRRIFEPFFTTRAPGEGTGLGLAMVHAVVKQHGGMVRFESRENEGTTFEVELPETDRQGPASEAPREDDSMDLARGSETVLVVDDRDAPLLAAKVILETAGYDVLVATRASEALDIWKRRHDIAVVLTDSIMPEMSGSQLLVNLRGQGFEGPAILMTAYDAERESAASTFATSLAKPFGAGRLAQTVRRALDEARRGADRSGRHGAAGPISAA